MASPYANASYNEIRTDALAGNPQAQQALRSRGFSAVEGNIVPLQAENQARQYATEARRQGLNPSTGLRSGLRPNVPLSGTFKGIELPRAGIDAADPNQKWLDRLKAKNPDLFEELTGPGAKKTALAKLEKQNPTLFKQLQGQSETRGYGAEQGIYGPGGYEKWRSNWDNAFVKRGMTPVAPEEWSKLIGGAEVPKWFTEGEKKQIKKRYGDVSWFAGSGPFDYVPKTEEGTMRVLNRIFGTEYADRAAMQSELEPALLWNQINSERQRFGSAAGGAGPLFSNIWETPEFLRTSMMLGAGPNARGFMDQGAINHLFSQFAGGGGAKLPEKAQAALADAQAAVPGWFGGTLNQLRSQGIPEESLWTNLPSFLGRPGINLTDPSRPLFRGGSDQISSSAGISAAGLPSHFADFGSNSAGLLASMTPQEFLEEAYPLWYQYHASSPDPSDPLNSVRTYPDVARRGLNPRMINNQGERGALADTPAYKRWTALGFPGGGGQDKGRTIHERTPAGALHQMGVQSLDYDPLRSIFDATLQPGQNKLSPSYQYALDTGVRNFDPRFIAAYTGNPADYWSRLNPEVSQYAPYNLPPETLARLMALIGG